MYSLCGQVYPLQPSPWLPILLASCVYFVPTFMPWRRGAIAVCLLLMVLVAVSVGDAFLWYRPDICLPPYDQQQYRQLTLVAAGSLAVVIYFQSVTSRRPVEWGNPVRVSMLLKQYFIAVIPALALLIVRLF